MATVVREAGLDGGREIERLGGRKLASSPLLAHATGLVCELGLVVRESLTLLIESVGTVADAFLLLSPEPFVLLCFPAGFLLVIQPAGFLLFLPSATSSFLLLPESAIVLVKVGVLGGRTDGRC